MTIFNNTPFLQDYPAANGTTGAEQRDFAQGYGNRVASARFFAPLGHLRDARENARLGLARPPVRAHVACTAGACG